MPATCPDFGDCAMCRGDACNACTREPRSPGEQCGHDPVERHSGTPLIEARTGTPTMKIDKLLMGRIEIDLADGDSVAGFLELVARIARVRGRLTILVE